MPDPFRGESIFRFKDVDNKQTYVRVTGNIRIYRPKSAPEEVIYHAAIRYAIRKTHWESYVIQLRPGVTPFDGAHKPITGRKVGPRTKKVTRAYFNEKWRKRLMAFTQLLTQTAAEDKETSLKLGDLVTLCTDRCLDETMLASVDIPETEEPSQDDVQVSEEEMEESRDD